MTGRDGNTSSSNGNRNAGRDGRSREGRAERDQQQPGRVPALDPGLQQALETVMEEAADAGVERELEVRLVLSPEFGTSVPARLSYFADDPYAVHLAFHTDSDAPVVWVFARELIVEGMFRACGQGDVRVWPARAGGRPLVCLALSSPAGEALLEIPGAPVAEWIEQALRLVPSGAESRRLRLDDGLERLLAGS